MAILSAEEAIEYALSFPDTYRDVPFHVPNCFAVRVNGSGKMFLLTLEQDGQGLLDVKVRPEWNRLMREAYASVKPGYHLNKEHWSTILLDGTVPDEVISMMIAESYDLVTDTPTKRIYEAVKKIPQGHVATYQDIACLAGNPKMCRAVGNALHKNPDPEGTPCFRVVNAKGRLSGAFAFGGPGEQARRLREDGVEVVNDTVDLKTYGIRIAEDADGKFYITEEPA